MIIFRQVANLALITTRFIFIFHSIYQSSKFIICNFRAGDRPLMLASAVFGLLGFVVLWPGSNTYPKLGHFCMCILHSSFKFFSFCHYIIHCARYGIITAECTSLLIGKYADATPLFKSQTKWPFTAHRINLCYLLWYHSKHVTPNF